MFADLSGSIGIPQEQLLAVFAVIALLGVFIVFILIFSLIRRAATKKKKEEIPDSHKLILEMQQAMIKEMRGTTVQNWIMILLTVVFIAITVFGGSMFVVLFKKMQITTSSFLPELAKGIKALFNR